MWSMSIKGRGHRKVRLNNTFILKVSAQECFYVPRNVSRGVLSRITIPCVYEDRPVKATTT